MANIFDYDKKSFKAFSKFYGKAPKKARRATARLLSQFAFGTREEAIKEIGRSMTVRTPKFVKASLRWKGARAINIDEQQSSTFSIKRGNSTGWIEQEEGKPDKRTRSQSLLARGNNFNKKVQPKSRMKSTNTFFTAGDFDLPSGKRETPSFIRVMKKNHKNKAFIIKKRFGKIKRGVYKFNRNRMMILQNFEKKPQPVKRNQWMKKSRQNFFKSTNINREWNKAIDFILRKRKF